MATVFDDILTRGALQAPKSIKASHTWYRNAATKVNAAPATLLWSDRNRLHKSPMLGNMYLFRYDPKGKETLPFYDTFPLIFPFASGRTTGRAGSGPTFFGLNFHYLPLRLRARLMDALYLTVTNAKMPQNQKMKISYSILKSAAQFKYFKPCVKQYLFTHVRSDFFKVEPEEWDMALFLPLARFKKATNEQVYKDSIKRIKS